MPPWRSGRGAHGGIFSWLRQTRRWASLTIRGMSGELPLRPMTLGELLDAAVELVRLRARPLLVLAGVLAVSEQLVLSGPRRAAGLPPPFYGPVLGICPGGG